MSVKSLCILGATGSIGLSTIDVAMRHPDRFQIHTLTAFNRMADLARLVVHTGAKRIVVPDEEAGQRFLQAYGDNQRRPEILYGQSGLVEVAGDDQTDVVMAAIVGVAGLPAALAAALAGKQILLANKEALVAAGAIFMRAVQENGATLLPIDSEHNAIFQCMPESGRTAIGQGGVTGVRRLLLTASGGPFRTLALDKMQAITPEQACAHPNWSMGQKISVDSATMVNKGLEVIEAHWLFDMPVDKIEVLIHPQSVIHSMVSYDDGSVLAQLGNPDMRTPIAHALAFPERIHAGVDWLDLIQTGRLEFEPVEEARYPCLTLAYQALRTGQHACVAFNAANELAVEAFLQGGLRYMHIPAILDEVLSELDSWQVEPPNELSDVLSLDEQARQYAAQVRDRLMA
ncbi:1-deoxy-D-xylulose-5-phosphate reductoisomerase [Orrella sp. 11846]|uniref:1-deoxy-D-xylulose-5-phosphate reductoisomerase n=1 Tax=Orrella sp. 11846 TaxID=3409913 RepID=UPI003B599BCE